MDGNVSVPHGFAPLSPSATVKYIDYLTPRRPSGTTELCDSSGSGPLRRSSGLARPFLGHHRQQVILRDRGAGLVRDVGIPAHLAVRGVLPRDDLLAGQCHGQLVTWIDRRQEPEVLQPVVGQYRTRVGVDEQPGRE